ncbi:MAG TPA: hypothetical protein VFK05_12460 [Polyangiaceae bacterium]|nr:hypothetical protein [Polyangiaceae bacterium]
MTARPLPEDALLNRFWPTVVSIAHLGKADEALEFVREIALLEGKLHVSIVPGAREIEVAIKAGGFVGLPMQSRFPGACSVCGGRFAAGADILYDRDNRRAAHNACGEVAT